MKISIAILVVFIALFLGGCDGHARLLYLKPVSAMKPPWSVASVVLPIEESIDVIGIVKRVAEHLDMKPDPGTQHRWILHVSERATFVMSVTKDDSGYWQVSLLDWPSAARSDPSKEAETMIRSEIKEPNKSPETRTTSGPVSA